MLCEAGNALAEGSEKLGNMCGKLELVGLGVAGGKCCCLPTGRSNRRAWTCGDGRNWQYCSGSSCRLVARGLTSGAWRKPSREFFIQHEEGVRGVHPRPVHRDCMRLLLGLGAVREIRRASHSCFLRSLCPRNALSWADGPRRPGAQSEDSQLT